MFYYLKKNLNSACDCFSTDSPLLNKNSKVNYIKNDYSKNGSSNLIIKKIDNQSKNQTALDNEINSSKQNISETLPVPQAASATKTV